MRLPIAKLFTLAVAVLPGLGLCPGLAFGEQGPLRPSALPSAEDAAGARVIVKYKALGSMMRALQARPRGAGGPQEAATLARRTGLSLRDGRIVEGRTQVVHGDASLSSAALAARLAADPEVEYAVPDGRRYALAAPNDPLYAAQAGAALAAGQWYLRAPDATFVSAINAEAAWDITPGLASIVVADLDTGVLFNHPDLTNKLYPGYDFVSSSSNGDGNGVDSDASDPGDWNTAGQCGAGSGASNSSWHGTQTASIIGAQTGNGIGMASVGNAVMIEPVRVLGKCGGSDSDIIAAMLWAGGVSANPVVNPHPARVINLSLGGSGSCAATSPTAIGTAYTDAINQLAAKGVVVVVAAGNDEGLALGLPANCPGVIAVAGVRHTGTKVGYSSIGPEVAVSAPAGNCVNTIGACLYPILTATNSGTTTPSSGSNTYSDSTNYSVGTSFSTPMVSGAAALMLSANPALTPAQVKSLIQTSARSFPAQPAGATVPVCQAPSSAVQDECYCTTSTCGAGLLDVRAAVAAAAASATPTVSLGVSSSTVLAGTTVNLTSSVAVPAGRSIASYAWTLSSGSAIATISGAVDGTTLQVHTSGVGSFTVQLTVTDSAGQKASASATVNVNAPAAPTVSLLASTMVIAVGSTVQFDGSASSAASGLAVAAYQWAITSGSNLATITSSTNAATATVATTGNAAGSFTIRLTVTDSLGQTSSSSATVSVTASTPTASIAATAASVTAGASVGFDGSGSTAPAGRTISSYQWTLVSGGTIAALGATTNAPTLTVATSSAGSFTVQLTVTDSAGAQDSRTASVTVNAVGVAAVPATGGGGGGGAMSGGWMAALGVAVALLFRTRPRRA